MTKGYLTKYFKGVVTKKLSNVEINGNKSNQHEFNATSEMKKLLGDQRKTFTTKYMYINDDEAISENGSITWYDSRERNPKRSEYRLYFDSNIIFDYANQNDNLFIALTYEDTVLIIISDQLSTISSQLKWLFNADVSEKDTYNDNFAKDDKFAELISNQILETIGIETKDSLPNYLENMILLFNDNFPSTKEFSRYVRSTVEELNPLENIDETLLIWFNQEELLFKTFEEYLINKKLEIGFNTSQDFVDYALSVINRRKSRVGHCLENHLEEIFDLLNIKYDKGKVTENKSKPDFIFPSINDYKNLSFKSDGLTMLGAKSTAKDRWRQVLAEADRINNKHLITLETSISENQTTEMISKNLQLVVPQPLHNTFSLSQQKWLWSLNDFTDYVIDKQKRYVDFIS